MFFFSSRRRHTRYWRDWSSDVCSSDLAAKRTLGMRPFDVQIMGGIALHEGKIAEMKTGEGKTLAATMPVYLNALSGKGRSEEHTSELQSRQYLVCRLLLEKKKKKKLSHCSNSTTDHHS